VAVSAGTFVFNVSSSSTPPQKNPLCEKRQKQMKILLLWDSVIIIIF
jgi:hypothetical protein